MKECQCVSLEILLMCYNKFGEDTPLFLSTGFVSHVVERDFDTPGRQGANIIQFNCLSREDFRK